MTNNPTIDGVLVPRDLIARATNPFGDPNERFNAVQELRAMFHAPAVEWQESNYYEKIGNAISDILDGRTLTAIAALRTIQAWESTPKPLMVTFADHKKGLDAYLEQITALQSTIARLEAQLNNAINLDFQRRERITQLESEAEFAAATYQAARDRIAELESGQLAVWYGAMPESNGKTNWTAILHRKGDPIYEGCCITLDRSEYPDRVRYEADRVRYLIGELAEEPFILDYDSNAHSGYTAPQAAVAVALPEDWHDQLFAEMERRFSLSPQYHQDHMVNDDTQIGVEFAIEWIAACLDATAALNAPKPTEWYDVAGDDEGVSL